jgi:hypothetical protein
MMLLILGHTQHPETRMPKEYSIVVKTGKV